MPTLKHGDSHLPDGPDPIDIEELGGAPSDHTHDSDQITNVSEVTGSSVSDALEYLLGEVNGKAADDHSHTLSGDVTGALDDNTIESIAGIPVTATQLGNDSSHWETSYFRNLRFVPSGTGPEAVLMIGSGSNQGVILASRDDLNSGPGMLMLTPDTSPFGSTARLVAGGHTAALRGGAFFPEAPTTTLGDASFPWDRTFTNRVSGIVTASITEDDDAVNVEYLNDKLSESSEAAATKLDLLERTLQNRGQYYARDGSNTGIFDRAIAADGNGNVVAVGSAGTWWSGNHGEPGSWERITSSTNVRDVLWDGSQFVYVTGVAASTFFHSPNGEPSSWTSGVTVNVGGASSIAHHDGLYVLAHDDGRIRSTTDPTSSGSFTFHDQSMNSISDIAFGRLFGQDVVLVVCDDASGGNGGWWYAPVNDLGTWTQISFASPHLDTHTFSCAAYVPDTSVWIIGRVDGSPAANILLRRMTEAGAIDLIPGPVNRWRDLHVSGKNVIGTGSQGRVWVGPADATSEGKWRRIDPPYGDLDLRNVGWTGRRFVIGSEDERHFLAQSFDHSSDDTYFHISFGGTAAANSYAWGSAIGHWNVSGFIFDDFEIAVPEPGTYQITVTASVFSTEDVIQLDLEVGSSVVGRAIHGRHPSETSRPSNVSINSIVSITTSQTIKIRNATSETMEITSSVQRACNLIIKKMH